jgi:stearoyl-CoA desaturase (delta-9 desaturase)
VIGHGVTIGFHRLFAHRSFEAKRPLKVALAALGSMAFQGSIIGWVADHRRHHRYADRPGDPHSPLWKDDTPVSGLRGLWHAHVGWCFTADSTPRDQYARDLLADRDLVWIDRLFAPLAIAALAVPFVLGFAWNSWPGALTALLCAGFVRIGLMLNGTWSVNSVCHRFGKRPFATRDVSTNFAPLAVFTMGESWHNNHHAFPRSARHGFGSGQIDSSARIIQWFETLGWATNVNWPNPDHIALRREQVG